MKNKLGRSLRYEIFDSQPDGIEGWPNVYVYVYNTIDMNVRDDIFFKKLQAYWPIK